MTPLDELFVDAAELDQELLNTVLKPYLRIDRATLAIRPQERWRASSNRARVLAYLLARKAMRAHGDIAAEAEAVAPAELINRTGLPSGSVYPTLKTLYEARPQLAEKDSDSRYFIPDWAVQVACDILQEGSNGG